MNIDSPQVGSVTIIEIIKALDTCKDNLQVPIMYSKIIKLHQGKLSNDIVI